MFLKPFKETNPFTASPYVQAKSKTRLNACSDVLGLKFLSELAKGDESPLAHHVFATLDAGLLMCKACDGSLML